MAIQLGGGADAQVHGVVLEDLGVLAIEGADAVRFLQGQLSCDTTRLEAARSLLGGYHNPQGRTIALLRLVHTPERILAVLPRELAAGVATRLRRFVLRARVRIEDASTQWRITGVLGPQPPQGWPMLADAQFALGSAQLVCIGGAPPRWLALEPCAAPVLPQVRAAADAAAARRQWHRLDVAAGLPQVHAATSEAFVAQMLNLDALGAIAFDKGCYTGQEVIARAHYRGRVKRRMQRFLTPGPQPLAVGATGRLADGRPFTVVECAQLDDGRCEFLAVAPLPQSGAATEAGAEAAATAADPAAAPIDATALPLPYDLP